MIRIRKPEVVARGKRIKALRRERLKSEIKALSEVKPTSTKSKILNALFICAVFFGLIIYIINVDGIETINHILSTADYKWILIAFICVLSEWTFEAWGIHIPLNKLYPKHKFITTYKSNLVGKFFNNVTPFSSGGQPFQAYILTKYGLKMSDTFSVLMMKFIVYQVCLFSWVLILIGVNQNFFNTILGGHMPLISIGIIMNIIAVSFILLAGVNKNFILKLAKPLIKLASKIRFGEKRLIKDLDATIKYAEDSVSNYSNQFNEIKRQRKSLIKMYVAGMLQLLSYFSITFMIYKAFGNVGASYREVIMIQSVLLLTMSFIPTPGSGLGAEGIFGLFFVEVFKNGLNMAILFWRAFTYYLPILIGPFALVSINRKVVNDEISSADNYKLS